MIKRLQWKTLSSEIVAEGVEISANAAELIHVKDELVIAQEGLAKAEVIIQAHVDGLEEIMFMTSHKVRQPIANILGIANILDQFLKTPATIKKMVDYIKQSTLSLDGFTKELSLLVNNLKKRT
jgi:signal transduction histidine kinase